MSELRELITEKMFEQAYEHFLEQADENAKSKMARGSRTPFGMPFKSGKNAVDGVDFTQHFGQGAASKTPYLNWGAVSIYYIVDSGRIVMGIEKDRYKYLDKMSPLRYERFDNRKTDIAVFYETTRDKIDYHELYNKFLKVSEEVMRLGW